MTNQIEKAVWEDIVERELPFGGLFETAAMTRILGELVGDPNATYAPKRLKELTGLTYNSVRAATARLEKLGILTNVSSDRQHPLFSVDRSSKRLLALTLLTYGILDDQNGGDSMEMAMGHYHDGPACGEEIRVRLSSSAAEGIRVRVPPEEAARLADVLTGRRHSKGGPVATGGQPG